MGLGCGGGGTEGAWNLGCGGGKEGVQGLVWRGKYGRCMEFRVWSGVRKVYGV